IVAHDSTATTTATHSTSKGTGVNASAGSGLFDVFPGFGVKADQSTSGKGTSTASTRIVDRITVTVMEVLPNGNLRIQGARTIKMEKDEMKLIFSGVVRPNDISYDNSVSSLLVADQRLEEQSSGPIASKRRPGILSRLLDYLW
ncbi:MAG TPA: flagellar basal body L-ring protein FlgH, partial [Armatimonadota bacterium]|nr:flagellar basal body L-ring protein FlgH [Armatimonadota bacterium]